MVMIIAKNATNKLINHLLFPVCITIISMFWVKFPQTYYFF